MAWTVSATRDAPVSNDRSIGDHESGEEGATSGESVAAAREQGLSTMVAEQPSRYGCRYVGSGLRRSTGVLIGLLWHTTGTGRLRDDNV